MIFRQWQQVLDGMKTQTRRLRFPWELAVQLCKRDWRLQRPYAPYTWADWQDDINDEHIAEANCILAEHYVTLPIKPHRTAKAVGRFHPINVRRERLQDISLDDVFAEGVGIRVDGKLYPITVKDVAHEEFARLWNSIYAGTEFKFAANPEAWVLTFELADGT